MKLSQLEVLIKAMRANADAMRVTDPQIVFYVPLMDDYEPSDLLEIGIAAASVLSEHVCSQDGDVAHRGDIAIPLRPIASDESESWTYECLQADGTIYRRKGAYNKIEATKDMLADQKLFTGCTNWQLVPVVR